MPFPFLPNHQAQTTHFLTICTQHISGHNGAGKTTTINILTGMFNATRGDAYVYDRSVTTEQEACRNMIGVCPQHDVLLPTLTVREHCMLWAKIKKVDPTKLKEVVDAVWKCIVVSYGFVGG